MAALHLFTIFIWSHCLMYRKFQVVHLTFMQGNTMQFGAITRCRKSGALQMIALLYMLPSSCTSKFPCCAAQVARDKNSKQYSPLLSPISCPRWLSRQETKCLVVRWTTKKNVNQPSILATDVYDGHVECLSWNPPLQVAAWQSYLMVGKMFTTKSQQKRCFMVSGVSLHQDIKKRVVGRT